MKFTKSHLLSIVLGIVIVLPYLGVGSIYLWNKRKTEIIENACFVVISKQKLTLSVYDYKGDEKCTFPIACGKNWGDKNQVGDMKTPEGVFHVSEIQNAENWSHDFKDEKGEIAGAYGPFFIRLDVPSHSGIGIHGTHDNNSLGTRATEGCIRLQNENVLKLVELIHAGTTVVITPSVDDIVVKEDVKKEENQKKEIQQNNYGQK